MHWVDLRKICGYSISIFDFGQKPRKFILFKWFIRHQGTLHVFFMHAVLYSYYKQSFSWFGNFKWRGQRWRDVHKYALQFYVLLKFSPAEQSVNVTAFELMAPNSLCIMINACPGFYIKPIHQLVDNADGHLHILRNVLRKAVFHWYNN